MNLYSRPHGVFGNPLKSARKISSELISSDLKGYHYSRLYPSGGTENKPVPIFSMYMHFILIAIIYGGFMATYHLLK